VLKHYNLPLVFFAPEAGEGLDGVCGLHGMLEGGVVPAEEGIGGFFDAQPGGDGGFVALALGGDGVLTGLQLPVGGVNGAGKLQILQGIFVGAPDAGIVGQVAELAEGVDHLGGGAFKQAPTASGKEGVATKQLARLVALGGGKVVGDVGAGVPRHEEDLGGAIAKPDFIPFLQEHLLSGNASLVCGSAIDGGVGELAQQGRVAAHMVAVVVGVEDGDQGCP